MTRCQAQLVAARSRYSAGKGSNRGVDGHSEESALPRGETAAQNLDFGLQKARRGDSGEERRREERRREERGGERREEARKHEDQISETSIVTYHLSQDCKDFRLQRGPLP